jgi:hypothetical protein
MKISKIFAGMSALAIASLSAITAFADGPNVTSSFESDFLEMKYDEEYKNWSAKISLSASEYDPATVTGVKVTFTTNEADKGVTGGLALNSSKSSWDAKGEWGTPGTEKEFTAEGEGTEYTLTYDFGALGEEYWGAPADTDYWAEVFVQFYWADEGVEPNITNVEIIGEKKSTESQAESQADSSSSAESSSTADSSSSAADSSSKAATTTNNNTKNTTTAASSAAAASDNTNQATGATTGLALAGLALAGAIAVVSKKKN